MLASQLLGKIKRLARFLMYEHPDEAEYRVRLVEMPQVADAVSKGNGVVRLEHPTKTTAYIVVHNDMRYLSSKPPDWVNEKDIEIARFPSAQVEPVLFPQLEEACKQLQALSPKTYEESDAHQILESVSMYYGPEGIQDDLEQVKLSSAVCEATHRLSREGRSQSTIEQWAKDSQRSLLTEYFEFKICGDTVRPANATLIFYMLSPARDRFFEIGTTLLGNVEGELETALQDDANLTIIPQLDVGFYLRLGELVGQDALVPVERAAHVLHSYADNLREQALTLGSFEGFHQLLYGALLHYRGAQLIYDSLLSFYGAPENVRLMPGVDLEELERESIVCEEMRTVIGVSLLYTVADNPGGPNFSQIDKFGTWLNEILSYEYEAAEEHIHDVYSRLLYPRFMRDTALGWILLVHGIDQRNDAAFDRGVRYFLQAAEVLESNFRGSLMPFEEPNRLIPLYQTLANALREFGRLEEARIYESRATPEYTRSLLSSPESGSSS